MTNDKTPDAMNEEELARFFEERRGDATLWDKARRIRVRRGSPSTVFTVRLAPEEFEQFYRAAAFYGETMSEFLRKGAAQRSAAAERRMSTERRAKKREARRASA